MESSDEKIDTGSSTKVKSTGGSIWTGIVFSWEVLMTASVSLHTHHVSPWPAPGKP